jgi:hypothetical protein
MPESVVVLVVGQRFVKEVDFDLAAWLAVDKLIIMAPSNFEDNGFYLERKDNKKNIISYVHDALY